MEGNQAPPQPPPPVIRAPREAWRRPSRVEPVPGTPFGMVIYGSPPVTSGPAVGSLVAGIAALVVALVVLCFGLAGAAGGWGPVVAGAFGVLAGALGLGGLGLGAVGMRRTRRVPPGGGERAVTPAMTGRGLAVAGLACGGAAVALTGLALVLSLVVALT